MISAINAAKFMIALANNNTMSLTNLHLQKMLYFAQGVYYGVSGSFMFVDEIEAWQYGPVIPEVYHEFKKYGAFSIDPSEGDAEAVEDPGMKTVLTIVVEKLGGVDPWRLVDITHKQAPWCNNYVENQRRLIPKSDIQTQFGG